MARSGSARLGRRGRAWSGGVWRGPVRFGSQGAVRPCMVWPGAVRPGATGLGMAVRAREGAACLGEVWPGMVWWVTAGSQLIHYTRGIKLVTESTQPQIEISRIDVETLRVPVVGTSELIVHRMSEKEKRKMLDAMQGRKSPKEPKNPEAEFEAARYRFTDGGDGIPINAFKQATVGGARFYGRNQVTMVGLRAFIFMRGEVGVDGIQLARIEGDVVEPKMREDAVRVNRGGSDLRYRPSWPDWRAVLEVTYVKSALTRESVLSLIDAGGLGIGVGEWRPEKNGEFGTYRVDPDVVLEVLDV